MLTQSITLHYDINNNKLLNKLKTLIGKNTYILFKTNRYR